MKILCTLFLFSTLFFASKAQDEFKCGVTSDAWKQEREHFQIQQAAASYQRTAAGTAMRYIPLSIHFVRHTNGSPGINSSVDLFYKSLMRMNQVLFDINIQFYIDGNIQYINNDAYLKPVRGSADHNALLANKNPNTANVWINDGWTGTTATGIGMAGGVELADLSFFTVIHEFGHFFSLAHTFETSWGIEHVARTGANSNCTDGGDGLCDTEADPYGLTVANNQISGANFAGANCSMTSNTRDLAGALYTPPFNNIMSYYFGKCGCIFTPDQHNVMNVSYTLFHSSYTPITGSGVATAPTNLSILHLNGYDAIGWQNASGAAATQIEMSIDNGATWKVVSGELGGITSSIIHGTQKGSAYLFRTRHLNSITYSNTITYLPEISAPLNPIQIEHPDNTVYPAINGLTIASASLNRVSTGNQFYSLYSPASIITLNRGGTYPMVLNLTPTGLGTYAAVWLDENGDGSFNNTTELKYQYFGATAVFTANINMLVSETADTGFVRMRIRIFTEQAGPNATGISNFSETEDYVFKIINAEQQLGSYCSPVTTGGCSGSDYGVNSFAISAASFTNTSTGCGVTSAGYSDFSSMTINLVAGQSYSFTETNGPGWSQNRYLSLYLDANQNGSFDSNELVFSHGPLSAAIPSTGNISVPSNATNGTTRLRIRAYQNSIQDGCANAYYGETEDYSVNITGGKEPRVKNMSITNITTNSMLINWQKGGTNNPTGYTIKMSTDGVNFTSYATATGSATSYMATSLQPNTRYYFQLVATGPINSDPKIVYGSTSSLTTAITEADLNAELLRAFPNPVQNELHIIGAIATDDATIIMQNILGQQVVCSSSSDENGLIITTNQLSKGIYFVKISLGEKNQIVRFIKE